MSIASRLAALEAVAERKRPRALMVLCKTPGSDEAKKMTVPAMIAAGAGWTRVCGGNDLRDLDKLLNHIKASARKQMEPEE